MEIYFRVVGANIYVMRITKYDDFLFEHKLSVRTKNVLLKWMASPYHNELTPEAVDEIEADANLRPPGPITLYRGLLFDKRNAPDVTSDKFKHESDRFTAWTTKYHIAKRFATSATPGSGYGIIDAFYASKRVGRIEKDLGLIISREFSPEEVLIDTSRIENKMTNRVYEDEGEVIVRPMDDECDIETVFTKKGEYEIEDYLNRDMGNNFAELDKYLREAVANLKDDPVELYDELTDMTAAELIRLDLRDRALKLYNEFEEIRANAPKIDPPEHGSNQEDHELFDRLNRTVRQLAWFEGDPERNMRSQYSDYYYYNILIGELYHKNADRMKGENRAKLAEKIQAEYGADAAKNYGFNTGFRGNHLFRMRQIVGLATGKIKNEWD